MLVFRKEFLGIKRLVVKVGSNVITKENGKCDHRKMRILVEDICELIDNGIEVILVSSGAVSIGKMFLKKHLPRKGSVDYQQSASSVGQPKLINMYTKLFEEDDKVCSQILLTHDDFRNRTRFLNAKQTIEVLLTNKLTPILNENDTISYTEISVGDNDHLAAQTAQMVNADALLIITNARGVYDRDPADKDANFIKTIINGDNFDHIDMSQKSTHGRGGMESKVHAVNKVTSLGIKGLISSKDNERPILDALTKDVGTYFLPINTYDPELRKAWLLSMKKLYCFIDVDHGAYKALLKSKSLLPKGIVTVSGHFFKGDCVDIRHNGIVFASGITEYDSEQVLQIKKKHSDEIEGVLGFKPSNEVIHTLNLVLNGEIINETISN